MEVKKILYHLKRDKIKKLRVYNFNYFQHIENIFCWIYTIKKKLKLSISYVKFSNSWIILNQMVDLT